MALPRKGGVAGLTGSDAEPPADEDGGGSNETKTCKALTKAGAPCQNDAQPGSDYCHIPSHQAEAKPSSASATDDDTSRKGGQSKVKTKADKPKSKKSSDSLTAAAQKLAKAYTKG